MIDFSGTGVDEATTIARAIQLVLSTVFLVAALALYRSRVVRRGTAIAVIVLAAHTFIYSVYVWFALEATVLPAPNPNTALAFWTSLLRIHTLIVVTSFAAAVYLGKGDWL